MKLQGRRQSKEVEVNPTYEPPMATYQMLSEGEDFIRNFNDRHGMTDPMAKKAGYLGMDKLGNKGKAKLRTRDVHRQGPEYWSEYRKEWGQDEQGNKLPPIPADNPRRNKDMMGKASFTNHDNKSYKRSEED
jgi:hypothetical protein